jgi:hypothetical protein
MQSEAEVKKREHGVKHVFGAAADAAGLIYSFDFFPFVVFRSFRRGRRRSP